MELDTINRLYLELSQVATAKTPREIELEKQLLAARNQSADATIAKAKELYGPGRFEAVRVTELLQWLRAEKKEAFRECFGSMGEDMLTRAVIKRENPPPTDP